MRQQLPQDVRIHGIITKGGDAPNIISDHTEARFYIRAATVRRMMDVYHRMERIVEGAALQTGCKGLLEPTQRNLVENIIPTPSFDAVYQRVLESLGEIVPPDDNRSLGSSDVGNASQVIPEIQPMIPISDTPVAGHSMEKVAACRSEKGLQSIALGAKALALTALELIENPALYWRAFAMLPYAKGSVPYPAPPMRASAEQDCVLVIRQGMWYTGSVPGRK